MQQFVVLLEIEQIVAEIDHHIPVPGKFLDRLSADIRRLLIVALEAQVPFFLPHHVRFLLHFIRDAAQPLGRQGQVVRFDGSIHASGDD